MPYHTALFYKTACLVAALVISMGNAAIAWSQDKPRETSPEAKTLEKRCKPVLIKTPMVKQKSIHLRKGEKPSGFTPLVAFQIAASGEVINVHLKRSSGIRDSDNYALNWIQSQKYSPRPGCPVIESEADVIIDFR
jgi:TonB family protein